MKIALIRHGKTQGNKEGKYIGAIDYPLIEEGIEGVNQLLEVLEKSEFNPQLVLTSPLTRCRETADILFKTKEIKVEDNFRELNFGDFEDKTYKELENDQAFKVWQKTRGETTIHNGESYSSFKTRAIAGLESAIKTAIENENDTIAIVCHGGTIMALLGELSFPNKDFYSWHIENANGFFAQYEIETKRIINIEKVR